jgi:hypothetical protein
VIASVNQVIRCPLLIFDQLQGYAQLVSDSARLNMSSSSSSAQETAAISSPEIT